MNKISKPETGEYHNFYHDYIQRIEHMDPWQTLLRMHIEFPRFLLDLPIENWSFSYGPGKWTLKELIQHIIDSERVFSYRLLRIARGDKMHLPGFDENEFAVASEADLREPDSIINEYINVRGATLSLIESLPRHSLQYMGFAADHPVSARAIVYIIAGHEQHHLQIIRERYLI